MLESNNKVLKDFFKIHQGFSSFWDRLLKYEEKTDREFKRLMKYGENAGNTRRLVSVFKDGKLSDLRTEMIKTSDVSDISIFRFLRKAAIINSAAKLKYSE